jgi:hypothetical protein
VGHDISRRPLFEYDTSTFPETTAMTIDDQAKRAITAAERAGYAVAVNEAARRHWIVRARNLESGKQSKVEAENPYTAAVALGRQLRVPLEGG